MLPHSEVDLNREESYVQLLPGFFFFFIIHDSKGHRVQHMSAFLNPYPLLKQPH